MDLGVLTNAILCNLVKDFSNWTFGRPHLGLQTPFMSCVQQIASYAEPIFNEKLLYLVLLRDLIARSIFSSQEDASPGN